MGHGGQASARNHGLNLSEAQREEKRVRNNQYYLNVIKPRNAAAKQNQITKDKKED
ncbi:MAG: hypothetical protein PHW62_00470 [Candidatus Ratteibacteria bacterium]|nr:hypothetical protein [Candidatus Ratteibacteria bacterium]